MKRTGGWKWAIVALAATGLRADTVILSAGGNFVTTGAGNALTVTTDPTATRTFERLYAGNGYFYLRLSGAGYVTANAGTLAATARGTATAEQFQTAAAGSGVTLRARSTSGYVGIAGTSVAANASTAQATVFTLTATPDATPEVEIDFANPRQTIAGFGAADAFYTGWLTAHPNKEEIYALLFGRDHLGASILRVQNVYGQQQGSGSSFDPDTQEVVAKANQYRGSPITVLMSSWSPPSGLKASGKVSCSGATTEPGCTLAKVNGGYDYAGFAQYWFDSLNAYAGLGVMPDYISLQNEPDFTPNGYGGCRFDAAEQAGGTYAGYREALHATYTRLQTLPKPPVLVGPEVVGLGYNTIERYLAALSPAELGQMGAVAHHLYHGGDSGAPDSYNASMLQLAGAAPAMPLFETEYDHSSGQATAMNTAWLIHNSMVTEEASAYLYWSYFWPDKNQLVFIDFPWSPSKWTVPQTGYALNDYYYAIQHFSRFVQPGFRRIASLTGLAELRASAYYSPQDRRLVFVLVNTSASNTLTPELVFSPWQGGSAPPVQSPGRVSPTMRVPHRHSLTSVYRSTFSETSERFASLGPVGADNAVVLPPLSVATIVVEEVGK